MACECTFEHPDWVKSMTIVGAYLVTGSRDEIIRVWDIGVIFVHFSMQMLYVYSQREKKKSRRNVFGRSVVITARSAKCAWWAMS